MDSSDGNGRQIVGSETPSSIIPTLQKLSVRHIIRMRCDALLQINGDTAITFSRVAKDIQREGYLEELWQEAGPTIVSYIYRNQNNLDRSRGLIDLLRGEQESADTVNGRRVVNTDDIREDETLYLTRFKVNGVSKFFCDLTRPDCEWLATDYKRRAKTHADRARTFDAIAKKLPDKGSIKDHFPAQDNLRQVLTRSQRKSMGL
jgi:hypothetical protein